MEKQIAIETLHLFPVLDRMLVELLSSLTPEHWHAQTVARLWKVKDVAAHLLDGNLRGLSTSRDRYFGEHPSDIGSYDQLVAYLNDLNLSWTNAARRVSPHVLISLLESTGKEYSAHLQSLDPFANAIFSVAWAGQKTSTNWFHIAREYTEKFLHQQQIRDAVGKPGIMTRELYYPFLDTLMYALPFTFKNVEAEVGTTVSVKVTGEGGGQWNIVRDEREWKAAKEVTRTPNALVTVRANMAWKLFSKSRRPADVGAELEITGDDRLGSQALEMVAVMA
ncbi:MAG: maleylpyruvate isomerase N-terminal domain-containing protein [Chryseolinea sp.]